MALPALLSELTTDVLPLLTDLAAAAGPDEEPEPEDVKAGWTAFIMFLIGCAVVALLGWNLYGRLKRAESRRDARESAEEDGTEQPGASD